VPIAPVENALALIAVAPNVPVASTVPEGHSLSSAPALTVVAPGADLQKCVRARSDRRW
jgi:hypothetical protein